MARVQADRTRPAVVKAPNTDNSLYYRGEKDKHRDGLREQLVKLVNDNDFEGRILAHKTLCILARGFGPEGWPESDRELRLAREVPGSKSLASIAQIAAAEGSLLFEKGDLESAAFHLKAALSHLKRCKDLDSLRQFVSSSWKAAEIAHALGDTSGAKGHIDRALRVSEEIGDLHGYCNSRIAEAHIAITQENFKQAAESLLLVSHPPQIFEGQPEPRFIYGELARAWAILEWQYHRKYRRFLGFVQPLWALRFSQKRLQDCMSFVMRVPFLEGRLAIASPTQMSWYFNDQGMPALGSGKRTTISRGVDRRAIFWRYKGLCVLCRKQIGIRERYAIDHIVHHCVGKSLKGEHLLNYRLTCVECNRERSSKDFTFFSQIEGNNPAGWIEGMPHDAWTDTFPTR